jgi:hypothetical protein
MPILEEREDAFEKKYVHDVNVEFQITSRRNRLLAAWLAGELGAETSGFVSAFVERHMQSSDGEVVRAALAACETGGLGVAAHEIRRRMAVYREEAERVLAKNGLLPAFHTFIP